MISIAINFFLISPTVLTQFAADSVQPDVTFSDGNDRFDLTEMIRSTNRMYHQNQLDLEDEDARRNLRSNEEDLNMDDLRVDLSKTDTGLRSIRRTSDFAYHDNMESNEDGTKSDFEANLKHFRTNDVKRKSRRMGEYLDYLHGNEGANRRSDSAHHEKEVLMHYAMPIVMTVDGFMQVPIK